MDKQLLDEFSLQYCGETEISSEVLSVLPSDPYEQLKLAQQLTWHAYRQKVSGLEAEVQQLKQGSLQKSAQIRALESRLTNSQLEVQDAQDKARQAVEDHARVNQEKTALINTIRKLNRDVAKLESFKRSLLQSLQSQEETRQDDSQAAVDLASDRLVQSVLNRAHEGNGAAESTTPSPSSHYQHSVSPLRSRPELSTHSSAHMYSPDVTAASTGGRAPPSSHSMANGGMHSGHSASNGKAGSGTRGANGNAHGAASGSPRLDGKEFFRQARSRLSSESFSQFLQSIKELNAGKQTREQTLQKARDIFGTANGDLYASFEGLLSRHLPPMS
ncbi:hypothetical protein WJX72_004653 [[Myrmecia] bisecta]|uniref:At4g15545-like C-terminal domain-containing protein n=1 Tax=[Myrmecia] bisecta TaxID=41462 RepID=A0AAW1Q102_9CHLO